MSPPRVLVIDAGLGNIGSVVNAFHRHDCRVETFKSPPTLAQSDEFSHAILPGVGSFSSGVSALRCAQWDGWIKSVWCQEDRPFLGICLGMQLLASVGTEGAKDGTFLTGLDLIPGSVDFLDVNGELVLPHVGWNSIHWSDNTHPLARGLLEGGDMYFVHSYVFHASDLSHHLASSQYGQRFTAVVGCGSCLGVQFHPEKSQRLGRQLLANFLLLPSC